jgi:trans-2-enoyl-CoA reductase
LFDITPGCEHVKNQIEYVQSKGAIAGGKKVLVIGASTGFGLASRISSALDLMQLQLVFSKTTYRRTNCFARLV